MTDSLTLAQLNLLRRCDGGLRVFESGAALTALQADLGVLVRLGLVAADDASGYGLTAQGERWLVRREARG